MSWATDALILIRLEGRAGEWVTVRDIADHMLVPDSLVRDRIEVLEGQRAVQVQRVDGLAVAAAAVAKSEAA